MQNFGFIYEFRNVKPTLFRLIQGKFSIENRIWFKNSQKPDENATNGYKYDADLNKKCNNSDLNK